MRIVIDFETRSSVNMKASGSYKYAEDSGTFPVCLAMQVDDEPPVVWLSDLYAEMGVTEIPSAKRVTKEFVWEMVQETDEIYAHNIGFEVEIWESFLPGTVLPLEKLRCTAAMSAIQALPRALGQVCRVLNLSQQKDTLAGSHAMKRVCIGKGGFGKPHSNHPQDLIACAEYCVQDIHAEAALADALRPMTPQELQVWRLDLKINRRGIGVDAVSCMLIEEKLLAIETRLTEELVELTGGVVRTGKQVSVLIKWLLSQGIKTRSVDRENVDRMLECEEIQGDVRRVLEIRRELAMSSPAKFGKMIKWAGKGGRARGLLMYHGASTGRWTGCGIQPQNLPRGSVPTKALQSAINSLIADDEEMIRMMWGIPHDAGSSCVRPMFISGPGSRFICSDFSSIEARALAWLTNEEETLSVFHAGEDLYKVMASKIYGVALAQVDKSQRQIGKVAVLACGYQGGPKAFATMGKNYGVLVEEQQALAIVRGWRKANPSIVQFWYAIESAVLKCVETGKPVQVGKIFFGVKDDFLMCRLPSGRMLYYYAPRVVTYEFRGKPKKCVQIEGTNSYTRQWELRKLYGGLIVENITQGLCRDIMAEAMLRLEDAGYPIVLTVHDEVLAEVPNGHGSLAEFDSLMAVVPPWAAGMPIGAEGWEGKFYRKG